MHDYTQATTGILIQLNQRLRVIKPITKSVETFEENMAITTL